jgi:hypothetical protein
VISYESLGHSSIVRALTIRVPAGQLARRPLDIVNGKRVAVAQQDDMTLPGVSNIACGGIA